MATSVPVPMAMPRSACASAAASFTPSPTMATTWPSACSVRTASTLSAGSTSAITVSMPTWAATAAGGPLVVAGQQHRGEPQRAQLADGLGAGGLHRVGHDQHGPDCAVPPGQHGGATDRLGLVLGGPELVG